MEDLIFVSPCWSLEVDCVGAKVLLLTHNEFRSVWVNSHISIKFDGDLIEEDGLMTFLSNAIGEDLHVNAISLVLVGLKFEGVKWKLIPSCMVR